MLHLGQDGQVISLNEDIPCVFECCNQLERLLEVELDSNGWFLILRRHRVDLLPTIPTPPIVLAPF